MKKVIKFLDKHRLILVLLILFIISIIFLTINSIIFLNHSFKSYMCTESIDDDYCNYGDVVIFKNAEKAQKEFFKEYETEIEELKENYDLPEWNKYTSYYYEVVSLLSENNNDLDSNIYNFFHIYNNTYNISDFYKENNFYYSIFYPYKINF